MVVLCLAVHEPVSCGDRTVDGSPHSSGGVSVLSQVMGAGVSGRFAGQGLADQGRIETYSWKSLPKWGCQLQRG